MPSRDTGGGVVATEKAEGVDDLCNLLLDGVALTNLGGVSVVGGSVAMRPLPVPARDLDRGGCFLVGGDDLRGRRIPSARGASCIAVRFCSGSFPPTWALRIASALGARYLRRAGLTILTLLVSSAAFADAIDLAWLSSDAVPGGMTVQQAK
jgi:hypothetical protein